jgi:hypothetical protein
MSGPTAKPNERPIYKILVRPEPGVDTARALRRLLKVLLRRFRLKCISVEQVEQP